MLNVWTCACVCVCFVQLQKHSNDKPHIPYIYYWMFWCCGCGVFACVSGFVSMWIISLNLYRFYPTTQPTGINHPANGRANANQTTKTYSLLVTYVRLLLFCRRPDWTDSALKAISNLFVRGKSTQNQRLAHHYSPLAHTDTHKTAVVRDREKSKRMWAGAVSVRAIAATGFSGISCPYFVVARLSGLTQLRVVAKHYEEAVY